MSKNYDVIVIGAGMSGLAAGIRLAMYNKKVCILEKHFVPGGLNSYYKRGKREFDVGLHAMTNFVAKGDKRKPLTKLLKQLRIPYDDFKLNQQSHSKIVFPEKTLEFTNDINHFIESVRDNFPHEIDNFLKLREDILQFNETALDNEYMSAKEAIRKYIKDDALVEMLLCPLLIYGSAWEMDMDYSQFVIMYKSIFEEGFARPEGGVRTIINLLIEKFEALGGELRYRSEVQEIQASQGKAQGVLLKNGETLRADKIISSMGYPETMNVVSNNERTIKKGKMSFTESIIHFDKKPKDFGIDSTIIFYNNRPEYLYQEPKTLFDGESAVICLPNNFNVDDYNEGIVRVTNMANYKLWKELERKEYLQEKERVYETSLAIFKKLYPHFDATPLFKDVFSPTTIERYTGHHNGVVYGSQEKTRDGSTPIENLYICGTDQGFLGIVGSMLSGISMANLYGLME